MGGHDCERFANCKVLRLCWKLQTSVWLCDTEIYSIGFQGIDYFHLCHSIPPGLSHLFLWHSLEAWSQKRTFWTMGLLPYSAFSDLLNSPITPFCNYSTPHLPRHPVLKQSGNLPLSFASLHRSPTSLCFTPPLLILTLGPFLAYWHVSGMTLLHICIPGEHLYTFIQRLIYLTQRKVGLRENISVSALILSRCWKRKAELHVVLFSKHLLLDVK